MKLNKIEIPKNIKPFDITEDHIQYCNRCDTQKLKTGQSKRLD